MPATKTIRLFRRLMARLPESLLIGPRREAAGIRAACAMSGRSSAATRLRSRIQVRGGGEGGFGASGRLSRAIGVNSADALAIEGVAEDVSGTAETPAHLNAQAASSLQWFLDCLPQSWSIEQQSACAEAESVEMTGAAIPATGNSARDRAVRTTSMARKVRIFRVYQPPPL